MEAASRLADSPRHLSIDDIGRIIDRSEEYTESVVHLGCELGLVEADEDGYKVFRELEMQLRQSSEEQRRSLLSNLLQQYQPFIIYASSLVQGTDPEGAARQTEVMFQLGLPEDDVNEQFLKLGRFSGLISGGDGEPVSLEFEVSVLTDEFVKQLSDSLQSSLAARLFLKYRLGDDVMAYLDENTLDELNNSLSLFRERPRSAIATAGRAVEDVQRDLGEDYGGGGIDYSKADGIGELTDMLQSDSLIMKRHLHGGMYLAGMRNPSGGHGKDPDTLERWDVSPEVALGYVLAAIHYIRSLYMFIVDNRQVL